MRCAATGRCCATTPPGAPWRAGRVVDPFAPRRGRRQPARLAALEALAATDPAQALARLLAVEGVVDLAQFALARNLAPSELDRLIEAGEFLRVGPARAPVAVTSERLAALGDKIVDTLGAWHKAQPDELGPSRPVLIMQLRGGRLPGQGRRSTRRSPSSPARAASCARARYGACPSTSRG